MRSSRVGSKLPNILPAPCTNSTLSQVRGIQEADRLESLERVYFAFKELDPIPQFRATAKLGEFLEARFSQSF
jgi:hypothetical protein